ncbi:MAG: helix-turn-helix domain-containing protein [Deltaproteobacteria bacterium]|nr:MAG: helix-turn-helix domain-containing protein [Deltaproteobacteria bacterium]
MFSERLRLARKRAGLSLRDLASTAGNVVTAQAIGKYERGEMSPGSTVVLALGKALGVPTSFFFSPTEIRIDDVKFRKKASTRIKEQARVKADVFDFVGRYLLIEEVLGIGSHEWDRPRGTPFRVNSLDGAEEAAEKVRQGWNLGGDPIPDMVDLLEERRIKVVVLDDTVSVDGLSCEVIRSGRQGRIPVIVASGGKTVERWRMTLAHELGHLVMEIGPEIEEEKTARRFASAFLMPRKALLDEIGARRHSFGYTELIQIKSIFGVSAAALIVRLRDLDVISEAVMVSVFRGIGRTWRREEPVPLAKKEAPQRFHRLVLRALAEEAISLPKASELLRVRTSEVLRDMTGTGA